jgi:hypothetical protein
MGNTLRTMAAVGAQTPAVRREALESRQLREEYMGPRGTIGSFTNEQVRLKAAAAAGLPVARSPPKTLAPHPA